MLRLLPPRPFGLEDGVYDETGRDEEYTPEVTGGETVSDACELRNRFPCTRRRGNEKRTLSGA